MSRTVLFSGPSLDPATVLPGHVQHLPPARHGDVLAVLADPEVSAIGLVDGVFETCRTVGHKELLLALEHGVHLFGAASLGAIRAVELEPFGMVGIGRVHDAYRCGILVDDADVLVLHGPAELGFLPVTTALADLHLALLEPGRDIPPAIARTALAAARDIHFKERDGPALVAAWTASLGEAAALELADHLRRHPANAKRKDAALLVKTLARPFERRPPPIETPKTPHLLRAMREAGLASTGQARRPES